MTMTTQSAASNNLSFLWATPACAEVTRRLPRDGHRMRLKPVDAAVPQSLSYLAARDELLAATAHELRLPLTHIKGFVSSLRRTDVEWDEPTRRDFLAEIEIESDRLTQLVEQLLEAADPGRTATAPRAAAGTATSPAALVEGGLHRVRSLLGGRSVQVDMPAWLPNVLVDADALERVLANLLQNAATYSPPRGRIGISARLVDFEALELVVDDEGPGIPEEERAHIFDRYVRGRATPSTAAGHGLGLAICQAIVQAHGGGIRVDDAPGGGARFTIRLPVEHASRGCP
jgi:two-component system, OmpR family, sensor histidine kinase KdpD